MAAKVGAALTLVSSITSVVKKVASAFSSKSSTTTTSSTSTSSSSSSSSSSSTVFSALGNLIKLLPSGTVFLFQYLSPITSNNGSCSATNKALTAILIAVCAISCFISSFTDSYTSSDGTTHYGIATFSGMWPKSSSSSSSSSSSTSLSSYRLRFTDFVHAFIAVIIFAVLSLLDTNTVNCFYPSFLSTEKTIITVLPTVIGSISSTVFVLFPSSRNGVGSASSSSSSSSSSTSSTSSGTSASTA